MAESLRERLLPNPQRALLVILILIGAGCGVIAVLFHLAIGFFRHYLIDAVLAIPSGIPRALLLLLVPAAVGALLSQILPRLAPEASGGLALVRRVYAQPDASGGISGRTLTGTFFANALSLGAGTPLGPEGPTVVLTSGFASTAARLLGLPARVVRGMVPVGTAAGISAIFAAPITGVVFALEEVIGTASRGVLGGALVGSVAAAVVERTVLGGQRLLPAAPADWHDARELLGFAILGILAGAVAGWFPRVVPRLRALFARATERGGRAAPALRGALAGASVGLLALLSPEILGVGYESIAEYLAGGGTPLGCWISFGAKTLGMAIALAAPLVGGVFAPSLFIGAALGASVGHAFHALLPAAPVDPGAYALVGMGAFFAGFLRTPLAAVLIVFEVTGDYGLVVPLMLAVALSSVISRRISATTLVEEQLERSGSAPPPGREDPLATLLVRDVMATSAVAVRSEATLMEAARQVAGTRFAAYPVVDESGRCVGVLDAGELDGAAREGRLEELVRVRMSPLAVHVTPDDRLDVASVALARAHLSRCPVVESAENPRLLGFLAPSDLLGARLRASREADDSPMESFE